jgi:hypothetical protein
MASLHKLVLYDMKIGLADLLDNRNKALVSTKAGQSYQPMLAQKRAAIDALPPALVGGRPLAADLADTDAVHDGVGTALWHFTEAYLNLPGAPPEIVAAARRIRAAFIPKLDELGDSYASEAAKAQARRDDEQKLKADLKLFPVVGNNKTLDLWVDQFLTAGEKLDVLLGKRADNTVGRANAGKLRTSTIGLLNRLRSALADELEHDAKLPRNLDSQVFAYLDQLAKMRAAGGSSPSGGEEPLPVPPGAPPDAPPGGGTP